MALRYVSDAVPGIRRELKRGEKVPSPRAFRYRHPDGKLVTNALELRRIASLAIPPAWTDVWISPEPRGHIQATGRDAKGRKQYRYHSEWRRTRDSQKFDHMLEFARALPAVRRAVERDMATRDLSRERVVATVVRLLDATLIRVGNEEYARENGSYGLTTLRCKHLSIEGSELTFEFKGKSGKKHRVSVRDRRLARAVARCAELPGQELFQYVDASGEARSVSSSDVNDYIRAAAGADFTAKDFRTWAATVLAGVVLGELPAERDSEAKRNVVQAMRAVSERLGNTPTICRKSYVHPAVIDAYLSYVEWPRLPPPGADEALLRSAEKIVLGFLESMHAAKGKRAA